MPDPAPTPGTGIKTAAQRWKVFVAASKDPGTPGEWTEVSGVQVESLFLKSGATPSECRLTEYAIDPESTHKAPLAVVPNTEQALTGDGTTGTCFCGVDLSRDSLIRVQLERFGTPNTYDEAFLGVITEVHLDLPRVTLEYTALDYRYFMDRIPLYGRLLSPADGGAPTFNRAARLTFNEDGLPDRAVDPDGVDLGAWLPPRYNRDDSAPDAGACKDAGYPWADYWLLGHVWNYLRSVYCDAVPAAIAHLNCDFIADDTGWPEADPEGALAYLFHDDSETPKDRLILDYAITGYSLAAALDGILKRAGPYEWTATPGSGDDLGKMVLSVYDIHEGVDSIDLTWGDAAQTVKAADPDIVGGRITRTARHYFNRGYALGRKKVFEVTLDSTGESPTLIPNWTTGEGGAQPGYVAAIGTDTEDELYYRRVFLEWRAPEALDWSAEFFGGAVTQERAGRAALKQLLTWAIDNTAEDGTHPRVNLYPLLWRKDPGGSTWYLMPSSISVEILPDVCGFRLGDAARKLKAVGGSEVDQLAWPNGTAYTWNLDTDAPVACDFRITLAVEADECIAAELDNAAEGERPLELFCDTGNHYRTAYHSKAELTCDGSGIPSIEAGNTATFGPSSPAAFLNDQPKLERTLKQRMDTRHTTNIEGALEVWGLRNYPLPVGYLVGSLTVSGETPNREALDLNACIRSALLDRAGNTTTLHLNGF